MEDVSSGAGSSLPAAETPGVGSEREVRNIPILLISIIYPIFHLVNRRERC